MQHPGAARADRRRVTPGLDAFASGLDAEQVHGFVGDEVGERADGVGPTADGRHHPVGKAAVFLEHLGAGLGGDHSLEFPDQVGEGVRPADRTNQIVGVLDARHPVPHRLVHRVLQGAGTGGDGVDLGAQQLHPGHVEGLTFGVQLPHVDAAFQPEQSGRRRGGDAVLPCPGLRDHARFSHPLGE